mmetsp:Transcript_2006/g.4031  ORF Transcript_2006/g.4031 Transcript_2006/m.4031 type:complete len:83 (-) Transcript_2006:899-1147(-)
MNAMHCDAMGRTKPDRRGRTKNMERSERTARHGGGRTRNDYKHDYEHECLHNGSNSVVPTSAPRFLHVWFRFISYHIVRRYV